MMDKMVDVADTVHGTKVSFVAPNPLAPLSGGGGIE